jgi:uncharacterized protein YaiE (UPF0345 family)
MLQHNSYFDGLVQSIGFERNGRRYTAGVFAAGAFHFNTDGAERMTIISGELRVRLPGEVSRVYPTGTSFEVAAHSGFDVEASSPAAYLCEFL